MAHVPMCPAPQKVTRDELLHDPKFVHHSLTHGTVTGENASENATSRGGSSPEPTESSNDGGAGCRKDIRRTGYAAVLAPEDIPVGDSEPSPSEAAVAMTVDSEADDGPPSGDGASEVPEGDSTPGSWPPIWGWRTG